MQPTGQPTGNPQLPPQLMQALQGGAVGGMGQVSSPIGAGVTGATGGVLGQMGMNPAHDHVYNQLRTTLMGLLQKGVPGIDQVLDALNKVHVDQYRPQKPPTMPKRGMSQQAPQMPQQGMQ